VSGEPYSPAAFLAGKDPGTNWIEAGWDPEPVWTFWKKTTSCPHGDSSPRSSSPLQLHPGIQWSNFRCYGQSKIYPITGLDRPLGFQEIEALVISRHWEQEVGKIVSPMYRPPLLPRRYPLVLISGRPQGHKAARRIKLMKNPIDPMGNRSQPTAPPRAPLIGKRIWNPLKPTVLPSKLLYVHVICTCFSAPVLGCTRVRYVSSTAQMCRQYKVFILSGNYRSLLPPLLCLASGQSAGWAT
jgi:hypothetical protein